MFLLKFQGTLGIILVAIFIKQRIVRLKAISRPNNRKYIILAEDEIKFLGIPITSINKEFIVSDRGNGKYEINNAKSISKRKRSKIRKWLKDHKKFIED